MSIEELTIENFKLKIAGIEDNLKKLDDFESNALIDEIVRFISILPEVFSDDLDRKTLWERIGNGINVSLSKAGDDFSLFINNCIEYVKADPGKVASNENLNLFISSSLLRPKQWKNQFLLLTERQFYLIIIKARNEWNKKKEVK